MVEDEEKSSSFSVSIANNVSLQQIACEKQHASRRFGSCFRFFVLTLLMIPFLSIWTNLSVAEVQSDEIETIYESEEQREIANEIALSFAQELNKLKATAYRTNLREQPSINQTVHFNETVIPAFAENRGRHVQSENNFGKNNVDLQKKSTEISSSNTDVPPGLMGENNFVFQDIDDVLQNLVDVSADSETEQGTPTSVQGSEKYFPFGRDEIVTVNPVSATSDVDDQQIMSGSFSMDGLFADSSEPDGETAALRIHDVDVPVVQGNSESPHFRKFDTGGVAAAFPDQLVDQSTEVGEPPGHREHSDFDLQGMVADTLVPATSYSAALGEDEDPQSIQDEYATRLPAREEAAPAPDDAWTAATPRGWGDRWVDPDGRATTPDGRVFDPSAAARQAWAEAAAAASAGDWVGAAGAATAAGAEGLGVDAEDVKEAE